MKVDWPGSKPKNTKTSHSRSSQKTFLVKSRENHYFLCHARASLEFMLRSMLSQVSHKPAVSVCECLPNCVSERTEKVRFEVDKVDESDWKLDWAVDLVDRWFVDQWKPPSATSDRENLTQIPKIAYEELWLYSSRRFSTPAARRYTKREGDDVDYPRPVPVCMLDSSKTARVFVSQTAVAHHLSTPRHRQRKDTASAKQKKNFFRWRIFSLRIHFG